MWGYGLCAQTCLLLKIVPVCDWAGKYPNEGKHSYQTEPKRCLCSGAGTRSSVLLASWGQISKAILTVALTGDDSRGEEP